MGAYHFDLTRKVPELELAVWPHIFPGERPWSQSDEMDIHFCGVAPSCPKFYVENLEIMYARYMCASLGSAPSGGVV